MQWHEIWASNYKKITGLVSSGASLTSWGEVTSLVLVGHPSSDGVTIKLLDGVDSFLHRPTSHPIFSYWVSLKLNLTLMLDQLRPDNFESRNSLKLSSTNIRGLRPNFLDCESSLESNSPDILALCETNLDDSIDSVNFSVGGYIRLIWKDSTTHVHGLAVCVMEENSADSYLCFWLTLLHSVSSFSTICHRLFLLERFLIPSHLT